MNSYQNLVEDLKTDFKINSYSKEYLSRKRKIISLDDIDIKIFGTTAPKIKELAKKYISLNLNSFKLDEFFEINLLYFYIGLKKNKDYLEQINFLLNNKEHLLSWAITDTTYQYIKFPSFESCLNVVDNLINNDNYLIRRYGYLFLFKYIDSMYIDSIFKRIKNDDEYFIVMVEAWLLSSIYVKYPDETFNFLSSNYEIDTRIKLKTISKDCDSFRIAEDEKVKIKVLRKSLKNK